MLISNFCITYNRYSESFNLIIAFLDSKVKMAALTASSTSTHQLGQKQLFTCTQYSRIRLQVIKRQIVVCKVSF
jgi:hypothetical protein